MNPQSYHKSFFREGAARDQRLPTALDPANLKLDERELEDFMAYAQQYAGNLLYFDAKHPEDRSTTWDIFYRNEPSFLMARIAIKNPEEIKEDYDKLLRQFEQNRSADNFGTLAAFVFSRFQKIDRWYTSITNHPLEEELALQVRSHLVSELHKLLDILRYQHNLQEKKDRYPETTALLNKNNIWELKGTTTPSLTDKTFAGSNEEEKLTSASFSVNAIFETLFYSTKSIINYCKNYFANGIYQGQDHPPHIALFIAFIRLLGHQQAELNRLPARHLDHYYKEILQIQPRAATPDKTFVLLEPAKGFEQVQIEKDSLLSAGKDMAKKELLYKTEREIIVNNTRVEAIRSLVILKKKDKITNYAIRHIKMNGEMLPVHKSMFTGKHKLFDEKGQPAGIGFAIASSQFFLAKGERQVIITFQLKDELSIDEFDTDLFALRFTAEKGWIDSRLPNDHITIHSLKKISANQLELDFSISIAQASGIIAFSDLIHDGSFTTSLPLMQFLLSFSAANISGKDQADRLQQLNALLALRIQAVKIAIQAGSLSSKFSFDGVRNLELENHESVLDVTKPFYPFTTEPKVGSSFYIRCTDLVYKPVDRLSINIEWMLPDNFRSHYDKYFPPYDSNQFRASLSILNQKKWQPLNEISLIDANDNNGRFRSIRVDLAKLRGADEKNLPDKEISRYDTVRENGTLRLKLLYPDFGHSVYPQLITSTVLEKSSSKSATVDFYKIVKKQLYDSVISIKLPEETDRKDGVFKVVIYEVLEKEPDDDRARTMMISGLTHKLKEINGTDIIPKQLRDAAASGADPSALTQQNKIVVNDDRFIERILGFLKKITMLDKSLHFDEDEQDVKDVAGKLKDKMSSSASAILPSHLELGTLIINEINTAISQIVSRITDELLLKRKSGVPDGPTVKLICKKYIDEANEVINDMIARKIAILLSANDIPARPYTPQISTIAVNYISTRQLQNREDQFFHLTPFGITETMPLSPSGTLKQTGRALSTDRLFPLSTQAENELDTGEEGQLFIGLAGAVPLQTVTLFFHLEEGIGKTSTPPPAPNFWYLRQNEWYKLGDQRIISDGTAGLQTSGIIEISLPADLSIDKTVFDTKGLSWLCISVRDNLSSFPSLMDLRSQAVSVSFVDNQNDPSHFSNPLPANSIKNFFNEMPGIKNIVQPLPSINGKSAEAATQYYTRVSERLRHKQRAITNWDMEHLLLEKFPFIYKVKCINNYCKDTFLPGHVTVVPIVTIGNNKDERTGFRPPLASYYQLRTLESYLSKKTSPFVKIHAVNPAIQYVLVDCKVRLRAGKSKGFYLNLLSEELIDFLTPWNATDQTQSTSFSSKIYLSSIISFIDSREYVEFVTDIKMMQYSEDEQGKQVFRKAANGKLELFETELPAPHVILASAPAHVIEII